MDSKLNEKAPQPANGVGGVNRREETPEEKSQRKLDSDVRKLVLIFVGAAVLLVGIILAGASAFGSRGVDIFAGVEPIFIGVSPNISIAEIKQNTQNDFIRDNVEFSASRSSGLSDGDSITITAIYDPDEAVKSNLRFKGDTKTYVVKSDCSYVSALKDMDLPGLEDAIKTALDKQNSTSPGSRSVFDNSHANRFDGFNQFAPENDIFLKSKAAASGVDNYFIRMYIYTIDTIDDNDAAATRETGYVAVYAQNVFLDGQGSTVAGNGFEVASDLDSDKLLASIPEGGLGDYNIEQQSSPQEDPEPSPSGNDDSGEGQGLKQQSPFNDKGLLFENIRENPLTDKELSSLFGYADYDFDALLEFARAEIFARRGHAFTDYDLSSHYSQYDWYNNMSKGNITEDMLEETELGNLRKIEEVKQDPNYFFKWKKDDGTDNWHFVRADGLQLSNTWRLIKDEWYYFNEKGIMHTGWLALNPHKYYLRTEASDGHPLGSMVNENSTIDGKEYRFTASGICFD